MFVSYSAPIYCSYGSLAQSAARSDGVELSVVLSEGVFFVFFFQPVLHCSVLAASKKTKGLDLAAA